MKYFRLINASSRKEVGFQFQTNGFIEGYDIDGPNSRTNQENWFIEMCEFYENLLASLSKFSNFV